MQYKKKVLKNGLRVITVPMRDTQTATFLVVVGVGSRHESEKEAGLSHFLEHMFFKGTEKRPTYLDISQELDAIGGEFNAFTSKERTGYYAKVDAKYFNKALDVVSDMYLHSKIEAEEIEKEKGTILQELSMYEDTPQAKVYDIFEKLLYPSSPLGRETIGYKKNIVAFKRDDFLNYMSKFYLANETTVCAAGKIKEKEVMNFVENNFGAMKKGKKISPEKVKENQNKPEVKIKYKKTDQTHFILGQRSLPDGHKDQFALSVLSVILGGNMSSRLFVEVREKRGLAYSVHTFSEYHQECGYFATKSGVEHKNLEETLRVILDEYRKISSDKVSADELRRAKDFIKGKSVMGLESSDEVAVFFVDQEFRRKKILTPEEIFAKIDAVTESDILRMARRIFRREGMNLAVIGPHVDSKKLEKILRSN